MNLLCFKPSLVVSNTFRILSPIQAEGSLVKILLDIGELYFHVSTQILEEHIFN